jgi:AcrR family transcriptional regulator
MSGNNAATPRKIDRRVQRTRDALGDALVALIREKPLAAITVQNVLDRANVGRSTFYAHFRDKDDLFLSDVEDFFQSMASLLARSGDRSRRIAPVRELCAHVAEVKQFYSALVAAERIHDVLQLGEECFARAIDQRLAERFPEHAMPRKRRSALSRAFAGALLSLLSWWVDRGMPATPEEMDDIYHEMVCLGISSPSADARNCLVRDR